MRPVDRIKLLFDLVKADRQTVVVDVGANPFNGTPPYALLRRSGVARIIGFEPQEKALAALLQTAGPNETYLPYAVGSGASETLYLTRNSGLVSVLEPDQTIGGYLNPWWTRALTVQDRIPMDTRRLDDIAEIGAIDFLKIDIQGGELRVFEHGRTKLADTAVIQTEVAILPYYQGQPSFGDIQTELAGQGFIAHKFVETSAHHLGYPTALAGGLKLRPSQATVADLVYLRSPIDMTALPLPTLQHMAIVGDAVLQSYDLVFRCLGELVNRGIVAPARVAEYVSALEQTVFAKLR